MSSDNAAPILSRADTVNLISALRFHDSTDDERAAIHLKLTTTDAVLRLEIQRLTEERDAALAEISAIRELLQLKLERAAEKHTVELSALRAELEAERQNTNAVRLIEAAGRDQRVLKLIERITGDDFCEDLDCRDGISHELTGDLKTAADKLSAIYRHTHSALRGSTCHAAHEDWRKEADAAISQTAQPSVVAESATTQPEEKR